VNRRVVFDANSAAREDQELGGVFDIPRTKVCALNQRFDDLAAAPISLNKLIAFLAANHEYLIQSCLDAVEDLPPV
jgi:hypothetical protein